MPENEVISEIASLESDLELPPPDTVETSLAVFDNRPDEAAPVPATDAAASENGQIESPPQQDGANIASGGVQALPSSADSRDVDFLFEFTKDDMPFHNADGTPYVRYSEVVDDRIIQKVVKVRSKEYSRRLRRAFYRSKGNLPSKSALAFVLEILEAQAIEDGPELGVYLRVAEQEGKLYLDLCDKYWRAVEIDTAGWRVLDQSPVMFRRTKAMQALPVPDANGSVDELRRFVNVSNQEWPLVVTWLVQAVRPRGPYPVLVLQGEHGSSKSTTCRFLRALVDPNAAPLRADYRSPRDLMISAHNGHVVALDNLSSISIWLSDALCRLSTGGGFSTRKLYEDDEEMIVNAMRPILLNGIEGPATREDLLDRAILVNLLRIPPTQRVSEEQLNAEFEAARPRILGGLLTAMSAALRNYREVQLPKLPRMADFAIWATAAESALGLQPGEFMAAYTANRKAGNESAIEASPVGPPLFDWITARQNWAGTATALLAVLERELPDNNRRPKGWPSDPRALGGLLKRLAPHLREVGITVEFHRSRKQRTIHLKLDSSVTLVTHVTDDSFDEASEPVTLPCDRCDADPAACVTDFKREFEPEFACDNCDAEFDQLIDGALVPVATTPK